MWKRQQSSSSQNQQDDRHRHHGNTGDVCHDVLESVSAVFRGIPGRSGVLRALEMCRQTYPRVDDERFAGAISDLKRHESEGGGDPDAVEQAMRHMRRCMLERSDMVSVVDEEVDRVFMQETTRRAGITHQQ